jgi:hypothetical protein
MAEDLDPPGCVAARKMVTSGKTAMGCQTRNAREPHRPAQNHLFWLVRRRARTSNRSIGVLASGSAVA